MRHDALETIVTIDTIHYSRYMSNIVTYCHARGHCMKLAESLGEVSSAGKGIRQASIDAP